jgi:hypothetical protein
MKCAEIAAIVGATGRDALTAQELGCIDGELNSILGRIAGTSDFAAASPFLNELAELQVSMAQLAYKYKIALTKRQIEFVRDFDRWHSGYSRENLYDDIRHKVFPYGEDVLSITN